MNIAVVGLGLIGGSIAKACKQNPQNKVFGLDIDKSVVLRAKLIGAIDEEICCQNLSIADTIIIALYEKDTIDFVKENAKYFSKDVVVMDCTGTKETICKQLDDFAKENGFCFVGAHPMAGREFSGFEYSRDNLFENASIILTPSKNISIEKLVEIKKFWLSLGFGEIVMSTPEKHDKIIAYTSQLAHIVSSSYAKSKTAQMHNGFSAGSYKDMTRVANLNVKMWTELFLDNKQNLIEEISTLQQNLQKYLVALQQNDKKQLAQLLQEGVDCKQSADK